MVNELKEIHPTPALRPAKRPSRAARHLGTFIGALVLVGASALILGLTAWGLVAIWRAILG